MLLILLLACFGFLKLLFDLTLSVFSWFCSNSCELHQVCLGLHLFQFILVINKSVVCSMFFLVDEDQHRPSQSSSSS